MATSRSVYRYSVRLNCPPICVGQGRREKDRQQHEVFRFVLRPGRDFGCGVF